jgi:hypothetical protein
MMGLLSYIEDTKRRGQVESLVRAASDLAVSKTPFRSRVRRYWSGSPMEQAWALLHEAEVRFVDFCDQTGLQRMLDKAVVRAGALDPSDPVRMRLDDRLKQSNPINKEDIDPVPIPQRDSDQGASN